MQRDTSTLYDIYQQFNTILRHVQDIPTSSCFYPVRDTITKAISTYWNKHVNIEAVVMSALLSFDLSVNTAFPDKLDAARIWFVEFAAQYAWHYNLTEQPSIEQVRSHSLDEWARFLARAPSPAKLGGSPGVGFTRIDDDVAMLRAKQMADNLTSSVTHDADGTRTVHHYSRWNPKSVWSLYVDSAPILSHAALAVLSIAASEAAVERTFSAQDAVHTKKRNRLADETIEQEMFIKFNLRLLNGQPREAQHGSYIELDEDMEEVDDVPSLVLLHTRQLFQADIEVDMEEKYEEAVEQKVEMREPIISQIDPPPPPVDHLQRFIVQYVRDNGIHSNYKWREHHMSHLSNAAVNFTPSIKDTDIVLRRKIMAYVREERDELPFVADAV
jgi:hAT family C-terminal dimerisation region